jgi:hypothetical protein
VTTTMTALTEFDCGACGRPMLAATGPGTCTSCASGANTTAAPVLTPCPAGCRKPCCTGPPW